MDGEGSGRGSGRTFCQQSRVGSGQRFAGSGRVGSKKSDPWTTLSCLRRLSTVRRHPLFQGDLVPPTKGDKFISLQRAPGAPAYSDVRPDSGISSGRKKKLVASETRSNKTRPGVLEDIHVHIA